jgi:DNA-binding NtrC family response regulator
MAAPLASFAGNRERCGLGDIVLQSEQTIVAIAADEAVLRSLAFALGVEGFHVRAYVSWSAARAAIDGSICVIVDVDVCRRDADARMSLADAGHRIIVLTDGMPAPDAVRNARMVPKPLEGSDILAEVDRFRSALRSFP